MDKGLVVMEQGHGGLEAKAFIKNLSHLYGWQFETIELSKDEPLTKGLDEIKGLIVLGESFNIYEQYTDPYMKVYFNP